jgi:mono/diheme cytochrome c family protein
MKTIVKILLGVLALIIVILAVLVSYVKFGLPRVGDPPDLQVEITPERLERGEYLAWYGAGCLDCHTLRDPYVYSMPPVPGREGAGGFRFSHQTGFPGVLYTSNITPAGLGDWSDGEIFRAITAGVDNEGKALFPVMPYHDYAKMDKEDIYSIIAYIRTLEPIASQIPERQLDFPLGLMVNLMPEEHELPERPDPSDHVAYGEYVANAAGCIHCHTTQDDRGMMIPELLLAGGNEYPLPTGGIVRSANLTPDDETGIGNWSEEAFLLRFKIYADSSMVLPEVRDGDLNTVMAWSLYGKMTEGDLRAIYAYLQTVEPLSNKVEKFTAP